MILIHHNPRCSKSRVALQMLEDAGYEVIVNRYLDTGWTRPQLLGLMAVSGLKARDLLRAGERAAIELELNAPDISEDVLVDAMCAHPELVNRPIVCTPKGVALCRAPEVLEELLER